MTNKFAPTYRSLESSNYFFGSYMTNGRQRVKPPIPWSAGRRNLHTRRTMVRERSRFVKIKNIKKQNLLYGCFKKQSTQKISNQKMKSKERDKSILEYVQ